MKYTKIDEIRFWSKVNVSKKNQGCWYWTGAKHQFGYGSFRLNKKTYSAHRLALIFYTGEEKELQVLHSCDNPSCCNPFHLRWGTQKDNIQDSIKRKRHINPLKNKINPPVMIGEKNPCSVLNKHSVINIRKDRSKKLTYKELSKKYGVSVSTISQIINYKTWTHIEVERS